MSKEDYWNRVNRGICWACSKPASPGLRTCDYHTEYFRQKHKKITRERYWEKVGLGICIECSKPAVPRSKVCQYHKDKFQEQRKERRAKYLAEGKCRDCGKDNDLPYPAKLCSKCQMNRRQSIHKRRERYKKEGRCRICGGKLVPELDSGRVTCKKCRERASNSA